jgi:pyridinium-3,5-biscarboxylic acid mononucleotide sulfurtransferase
MKDMNRRPSVSAKSASPRPSKAASSGLEGRLAELRRILESYGKVVVAFSGGVDSSLLLKVAADVLGSGVHAVIASSPTYPGREIRSARALARALKVRHEVIATSEMDNPAFTANPPLRCYHCKRELMTEIRGIADRKGIAAVVDGQNADDLGDYRPGARAAAEMGVRSPLREAGLSKADIRTLSRRYGLPTWNKPAMACLASRFPYDTPITSEALVRVERAEDALRALGFGQLRVRHHDTVARIEVLPQEIVRIARPAVREKIVAALKKAGYAYVTLDLGGYRTGSMNETLPAAARAAHTGRTKKKP